MTRSIGIDLGTTNCCVATIDADGKPQIIANKFGDSTTPSMVTFEASDTGESEAIVGAQAMRKATMVPQNTFFGVKRLIGRRYDDPEVQALSKTLPYAIESAPNGDAWVDARGVLVSPPEISALVLRELREVAEKHFGGPVDEAIITVPAHFDNAQRKATADAAAIAGLKVRRLLNEPTAAALGYGAHRGEDCRLAVCDLGGGTFDVSIVNVEDGVIEVISSQGDLFLGGDDIDRVIMERLIAEIETEHGINLAQDAQGLQRLRAEVVQAKHSLSEATAATIELRYLSTLATGKPLDYKRVVKRAEISEWVAPVLSRLDAPCREAASRCGLALDEMDAVVLVGGMTRMPAIQDHIAALFGKRALKVVNPDEIVSIGAATECAILDGLIHDVVLLDVTSRALGLLPEDGRYQQVIARNATIPTREHQIVPTTEDDQTEVYFEVYEGEASDPAENRQLGRFVCRDLPKAPAGEVMLLVEFTVDVDGILKVSTTELGTGERRELRMLATAGLTRAEISKIHEAFSES